MRRFRGYLMFCLTLIMVMACSSLAMAQTYSGEKDNLKWSYDDSTGKLTVNGTGVLLPNIEYYSEIPWNDYRASIKSVSIGNGITGIGACVFQYMDLLESVTLADTVEFLEHEAFNGDSALKSVKLGKGLKTIGGSAFSGCTSLTAITLNEGLETIGSCAFVGTGLKELQIPSTVKYIDVLGMKELDFYKNLKDEYVIVGDGVLIKYNGIKRSITIPSNVKYIASNCFEGSDITSVTFPSGLKYIGDNAFSWCKAIKSVVVPSKVTTIGEGAFCGCEALGSVTIPSGVKYIGKGAFASTPYYDNLTGDYVVVGDGVLIKSSVTSGALNIPEGVKVILREQFYELPDITSVKLPSTLEKIEYLSFFMLTGVSYIELPESLTDIPKMSIGCTAGTDRRIVPDRNITLIYTTGSAGEKYCNKYGFNCISKEMLNGKAGTNSKYSLNMDTMVLTISGTGEVKAEELHTLGYQFGGKVSKIVVKSGITEIHEQAFFEFSNINEISLPDTLTSIGKAIFSGDAKISSLTIPKGVTNIDDEAFYTLYNLEKINVASGNTAYTSVDGVLYSADKTRLIAYPICKLGEEYSAPAELEEIGRYAFNSNATVKKIVLPANLQRIPYGLFTKSKITQAEFLGRAPEMYSSGYWWENINPGHSVVFYYDSEYTGWGKLINDLAGNGVTNIHCIDINDMWIAAANVPTEMKLGDSADVQVIVSDNQLSMSDVDYVISNPDVVALSTDGQLVAMKPGYTSVTFSVRNGEVSTTEGITVTGSSVSGVSELSADLINFTYIGNISEQFYDAATKSIYFLNSTGLYRYSVAARKSVKLLDLESYRNASAYKCGETIAISASSYYSGGSIYIFDLKAQRVVKEYNMAEGVAAVGIDETGRYYIAYGSQVREGYKLELRDADFAVLDTIYTRDRINRFGGFNKNNGKFFIDGYYAWNSWGYSHDMGALKTGIVKDNKLMLNDDPVPKPINGSTLSDALQGIIGNETTLLLYQDYFSEHRGCLDLYDNKYLVIDLIMNGSVLVLDTDNYDPVKNDYPEYSYGLIRKAMELGNGGYSDLYSIGTRTVYNKRNNSIIFYANDNKLVEIAMDGNAELLQLTSSHPVFNMFIDGDKLVLIEYDGEKYYIETKALKYPSKITLSGKNTMKAHTTQSLSVSFDVSASQAYVLETSDKNIATIANDGTIIAWKPGKVTVTAKTVDGKLKSTLTITITEDKVSNPAQNIYTADKNNGNNVLMHDNEDCVDSYLVQNSDGGYQTVRYNGTDIIIKNYTADFKYKSSKTVKLELPIWGGFFAGKENYYVIEGQNNLSESNNVEVYRIIKYTKGWTRVGACSVKGANTVEPFRAGSARMTEAGGYLYVYTCHTMYTASDGYNHQANVTFMIDEATMKMSQKYTDVMNTSVGYVSHSFNQYIVNDGKYIYRADHGDANPRGMYVSKATVGGDITAVDWAVPFGFAGAIGDNATGANLGGLAVTKHSIILAGNSTDQKTDYYWNEPRNIFITITPKEIGESKVVWLTDYAENKVSAPYVLKVNDYSVLVMWEENGLTKLQLVSENGDMIGDRATAPFRLSDCEPIINKDGNMVWYTDDNTRTFYIFNPYDMKSIFPFTDVAAGNWAYNAVKYVYSNGIVNGTTPTTYSPGADITRAQVAVMLWNMAGHPGVNASGKPFKDVEVGKYYTKAVAWCKVNNIVSGYSNGNFGPNDAITRQDFAAVLRNYAKFVGKNTKVVNAGAYKACKDYKNVSSYAVSAVNWAYENGLMGSNGTLDPKKKISRAEVASMLQRYAKKFS